MLHESKKIKGLINQKNFPIDLLEREAPDFENSVFFFKLKIFLELNEFCDLYTQCSLWVL